jgi:hypothetical protein
MRCAPEWLVFASSAGQGARVGARLRDGRELAAAWRVQGRA